MYRKKVYENRKLDSKATYEYELSRMGSVSNELQELIRNKITSAFELTYLSVLNAKTKSKVAYLKNGEDYYIKYKIKNTSKQKASCFTSCEIGKVQTPFYFQFTSELNEFAPNEERTYEFVFSGDNLNMDSIKFSATFCDSDKQRCYSLNNWDNYYQKYTIDTFNNFIREIKSSVSPFWKGYSYSSYIYTEKYSDYKILTSLPEPKFFIDNNSPTYQLAKIFYGIDEGTIVFAQQKLDSLVSLNNYKAMLWKIHFILDAGWGSYNLNWNYPYNMPIANNILLGIPKKEISKIEEEAKSGNMESIFLIEKYYWYSIDHDQNKAFYYRAWLDKTTFCSRNYNEEGIKLGINRAKLKIAAIQANSELTQNYWGGGVEHNPEKIINLCSEYYTKDDPDANYILAMMCLNYPNDKNGWSVEKGIDLAKKSLKQGNIKANYLLGKYYLFNKNSTNEELKIAVDYLILAANYGNEDAILLLATLNESELKAFTKLSDYSREYWLEKYAKENGSKNACEAIIQCLASMCTVDSNYLKYRYWKAKKKNFENAFIVASASDKSASDKLFLPFFEKYVPQVLQQFNPNEVVGKRVVRTSDGYEYTEYEYAGIGGGLFNAGLKVWMNDLAKAMQKKSDKQINAITEFVNLTRYRKYYGTIDKELKTKIFLKKGQRVLIRSIGQIAFVGKFSNYTNAPWEVRPQGTNDLDNARKISEKYPNGSLLIKSGDSEWYKVGKEDLYGLGTEYIVPKDGELILTINDNVGVTGMFDFEIEIFDQIGD